MNFSLKLHNTRKYYGLIFCFDFGWNIRKYQDLMYLGNCLNRYFLLILSEKKLVYFGLLLKHIKLYFTVLGLGSGRWDVCSWSCLKYIFKYASEPLFHFKEHISFSFRVISPLVCWTARSCGKMSPWNTQGMAGLRSERTPSSLRSLTTFMWKLLASTHRPSRHDLDFLFLILVQSWFSFWWICISFEAHNEE